MEEMAADGALRIGSAGIFYDGDGWVRDSVVFEYPPDTTVIVDESGIYINGTLTHQRWAGGWMTDGEKIGFLSFSVEIA